MSAGNTNDSAPSSALADPAAPSSSSSKPRARLAPPEVVQLPPDSDSEPEDDEGRDDADGEGVSEDFLKDYPDDAEVSQLVPPACDLLGLALVLMCE